MPKKRPFGVSTHLYHGHRLTRDHLLEIGAHGFESVELFATRSHFDYHSPAAVADLQQWLAEAGLELHSVHAPIFDSFSAGVGTGGLSLAHAVAADRERALTEAERALHIARRIRFSTLVLHLGVPRTVQTAGPAENSRDGARRSVEALKGLAAPLDVAIAVEVIPNELSKAGSLVHFVEETLDAPVGICLDFGHAHMDGDVVDAVETVSEHLIATHVHDNRGRTDDHLVPFDGTIDWPAALTAVQKVGYDGTLILELASHGSPKETLQKAQRARQRMEKLLAT